MENIIEVNNLTKKFGNFAAVDDITCNVSKGDIFAFGRAGRENKRCDGRDDAKTRELSSVAIFTIILHRNYNSHLR